MHMIEAMFDQSQLTSSYESSYGTLYNNCTCGDMNLRLARSELIIRIRCNYTNILKWQIELVAKIKL